MKIIDIFFDKLNISIKYSVGSNASDNFKIIDEANENDLWFHVDELPSCHVIAEIPKNLSKKDLKYICKKGALLCKQYSKFASMKDLCIVYTQIKNVEKTETIGSVIIKNGKKIMC